MVAAAAGGIAADSKTLDESGAWRSLGAPAQEVQLRFTLPTGQSFRWRPTGPDEFTGVIGQRVFKLRQAEDDILYTVLGRGEGAEASGDLAALREYFNLDVKLSSLADGWAAADKRFAALRPYIPGARVLRQDPVECAFEFICSSNNHISRIHGMVERLCRDFGTPLHATLALEGAGEGEAAPGLSFYAFPTLEQLSAATEAHLRAEGFGYRAKFITGSVAKLRERPEGGAAWLQGLRSVPYAQASEALCTLPGIGPKVAACVCLFALDKAEAIPVDTHVWQLACRHYTPHLRNKTLNKQVMEAVEAAFIARFGPYAGWAHNTLFIAELASQQEHLPEHLRSGGRKAATPKNRAASPQPATPEKQEAAAAPGRPLAKRSRKAGARRGTTAGTDVHSVGVPAADAAATRDGVNGRRGGGSSPGIRKVAVVKQEQVVESNSGSFTAVTSVSYEAATSIEVKTEAAESAGPLTPEMQAMRSGLGTSGRRSRRLGAKRVIDWSSLADDLV